MPLSQLIMNGIDRQGEKEGGVMWRIKGEEAQEGEMVEDTCIDCSTLREQVHKLSVELDEERQSAEETIVLVEKMERNHKSEIDKLRQELDFEKNKTTALHNSLEHERTSRMQELYKQDRQSIEYDHGMRDYKLVHEKNSSLGKEYDALRSENETLNNIIEELKKSKEDILDQLKTYEHQINELEAKNDSLRKRLYDADNEKDKNKVLYEKMKKKLRDYMNGKVDTSVGSSRTHCSVPLRPLGSITKSNTRSILSRAEVSTGSFPSQSQKNSTSSASASLFGNTRLSSNFSSSHLSTVQYIRKFNTDPITVSNSKKKNPLLWPIPH